MDGSREGEKEERDDGSYDDGDVLTWGGGGGCVLRSGELVVAYCLLFQARVSELFNHIYELPSFITKFTAIFYDLSVKWVR